MLAQMTMCPQPQMQGSGWAGLVLRGKPVGGGGACVPLKGLWGVSGGPLTVPSPHASVGDLETTPLAPRGLPALTRVEKLRHTPKARAWGLRAGQELLRWVHPEPRACPCALGGNQRWAAGCPHSQAPRLSLCRRREVHFQPALHGGRWERGGRCARPAPGELRQLPVLPPPHSVPLQGDQV